MKNFLRGFIAIWYLLGWMSHVYLVFTAPQDYQSFGATALIPAYRIFWQNFIMPHITFFALLLVGFEIVVGLLLINKGKWVKIGLVFSLLFNLFLIQMGLATQTQDIWLDFVANRMPNILFMALQIPLFFGEFQKTLWEEVKGRFTQKKIG